MLLHLFSWDFIPIYNEKRHIITINYMLILNAFIEICNALNMDSL